MNTMIIKNHIQENKKSYIFLGTIVAIGLIAGGVYLYRKSVRESEEYRIKSGLKKLKELSDSSLDLGLTVEQQADMLADPKIQGASPTPTEDRMTTAQKRQLLQDLKNKSN